MMDMDMVVVADMEMEVVDMVIMVAMVGTKVVSIMDKVSMVIRVNTTVEDKVKKVIKVMKVTKVINMENIMVVTTAKGVNTMEENINMVSTGMGVTLARMATMATMGDMTKVNIMVKDAIRLVAMVMVVKNGMVVIMTVGMASMAKTDTIRVTTTAKTMVDSRVAMVINISIMATASRPTHMVAMVGIKKNPMVK